MAALNHLDIYLEFEPIVKLVCEAENCQHNLWNASNTMDRQMLACNLKQITIGKNGVCQNFKPLDKK